MHKKINRAITVITKVKKYSIKLAITCPSYYNYKKYISQNLHNVIFHQYF